MGVVRYLCITILLVSLALAGPCSDEGWQTGAGVCVCNSGFSGADCGYNFGACNVSALAATNKKDDRFPVLDTVNNKINFENNVLQLSIVGTIVPNRKYTNIQFVDQTDDRCKLNTTASSFWAQSGNTHCQDEFHLTMPWSAWKQCGFGPQGVNSKGKDIGDYWEYRATFVIYYQDDIGQPFNYDDIDYKPRLTRHSTVAYKVWIHFQKIVEIEISQVLVNSTINLVAAITKFEYNPADMTLTLGIKTIMSWPNKYMRDSVTVTIMNNNYVQARDNKGNILVAVPRNDTTEDSCDGDAGAKYYRTNCMQYWETRIILTDGHCDFNADYLLSGTARTCRDGDLTDVQALQCTDAPQQVLLKVSKSDVCGSVTANPLISGKLVSYDAAHDLTSEYVVGYKGYFEVDMTTDNSFNLTWVDIWAVADSQPGDLFTPPIQWLMKDSKIRVEGFYKFDNTRYADFASSPVELNVHDITQNVDPNNQIVFTPKFDLRFDARIFHIPFTGAGEVKRGFTIHAIGKITYGGNEQYNNKRSEETVDFVWESSAKDMAAKTHFGLSMPESESAVAQTSSRAGPAAVYFYAPVAGLACVIVVAAVVAAVVAKKRTANSFATLAN